MQKYRRVTSGSILYFWCTPGQQSEPNTVSKPTESQVHLLRGSSDSRQTWSNLTLLLWAESSNHPSLLKVLQFCTKESLTMKKKIRSVTALQQDAWKRLCLAGIWRIFFANASELKWYWCYVLEDTPLTKIAFSSPGDWEVFTEVSPQKLHTCLCHEVSAVPVDSQHHTHDLHVSSKQHCQLGSLWSLYLNFLL